jgi:hypothetical protein
MNIFGFTYNIHYRIYLLCRVPGALGKNFAECCIRQRTLAKNLSAKRSLPSAFCRALGKEKHSAKCKSEKIQKKK